MKSEPRYSDEEIHSFTVSRSTLLQKNRLNGVLSLEISHRQYHQLLTSHTKDNDSEQQKVRASVPCRTDVCADPALADVRVSPSCTDV